MLLNMLFQIFFFKMDKKEKYKKEREKIGGQSLNLNKNDSMDL